MKNQSNQITRSLTTRCMVIGAAVGITALTSLLASAPQASATEFPPNPAVTASTSCTTDGGVLDVTFTNAGGLGPANFTVVVNGVARQPVTVQPDDVNVVHYQLGLNVPGDLHVSASGMNDVASSFAAPPCYRGSGSSSLGCVNDQPVFTVSFTNTGLLTDQFVFTMQNDPASPVTYTLAPGQSQTVTRTLADGAPISVNVGMPGHMATVTGSYGVAPICAPATTVPVTTTPVDTVPDTTAPGTTIPDSPVPTTVPDMTVPSTEVASLPGATTTTSPIASPPSTSPSMLPTTGSSGTVAVGAVVAIALGLALLALGRRYADARS